MKNIVGYKSVSVFLWVLICFSSLSAHAGNVLIKSTNSEGQSSLKESSDTASVTNLRYTKLIGVCGYDCDYSGFDGTIANLKVNGKLVQSGSIKVNDSKMQLDIIGETIVYVGSKTIVLVLTPEQKKLLEK